MRSSQCRSSAATRRASGTEITCQALFVSLSADSLMQRQGYGEALAVNAVVVKPLTASAWCAGFGMLTDRFGTTWSISVAA